MKRLLLLGAGYAHLQVLRSLRHYREAHVDIVLVCPANEQVYAERLPGFITGAYEWIDCTLPLGPLSLTAGIRWINSAATGLDLSHKTVHLQNGTQLKYDVLSINTGLSVDREAIPGARDHALFMRPLEQFGALWERMLTIVLQEPQKIAVIGNNLLTVELVLALQQRLGHHCSLALVSGSQKLLASYPEPLRQRVESRLRSANIALVHDQVKEIDAQAVTLDNGARLASNAVIAAPTGKVPLWISQSGIMLDEQGLIATNQFQQSLSHAEVFASGDIQSSVADFAPTCGYYTPSIGKNLWNNLRLSIAKDALLEPILNPYTSPKKLFYSVSNPEYAIAQYGNYCVAGSWIASLKQKIDARFIRNYQQRHEQI